MKLLPTKVLPNDSGILPVVNRQSSPKVSKKVRWQPLLLLLLLMVLYCVSPLLLIRMRVMTTDLDQSIWLLIILSLICYLIVSALCWWLLSRFWILTGLPQLTTMVSQFYTLPLWQQLSFYLASYALLLFAAMACLGAIC